MKKQIYSIAFLAVYVLWIAAFVLKLAGLTSLSWWAILAPIWILFALGTGIVLLFFLAFICLIFAALIMEIFKK